MDNFYVKTCLTLIVLLLTVIAMKPIFSPAVAEAQSSLSQVQLSALNDGQGFLLFDAKSGHVWHYFFKAEEIKGVDSWGKLTELGKFPTK